MLRAKNIIIFLLFISVHLSHAQEVINLSENKDLQTVFNLQHDRNTAGLIAYFENPNPVLRRYAALAMASVLDTAATGPLLQLIAKEKDIVVKSNAAYSLGQLKNPKSALDIGSLIQKEKSHPVRHNLMEALGKCGEKDALDFLCKLKYTDKDSVSQLGQVKGMYYFTTRNIITSSSVDLAIQMLHPSKPQGVRRMASAMMARLKKYDLSDYYRIVTVLALHETDDVIRTNMAYAFNRLRPEYALKGFAVIIKKEQTPEVRVSALRAMKNMEYDSVKAYFFNALNYKNTYVKITGSEMLVQMGKTSDAARYLELAKKETIWQVKANLYTAALKYSADKNKKATSDAIKAAFAASTNPYEKAALLKALSSYIENHTFIAAETFKKPHVAISTGGMEALAEMRKDPHFTKHYLQKQKNKVDLKKVFIGYIKSAISSGDVALIGLASDLLRTKELKMNAEFNDTKLLTDAKAGLTLPKDVETAIEIDRTLAYLAGTEYVAQKIKAAKAIDWAKLAQYTGKKATIKTSKGDIVLELAYNETPESVLNFIDLVEKGFYNKKVFHRVIANFVIQAGCPRGDGWGNSENTICSEFTTTGFGKGYLGMASAGPDTEGCQWFITHIPTPHLNGNYTTFGKVLSGMEVVNQITIGDTIEQITLN